ncbi:MAG TPA: hypothetical protein VEI07_05720, partial [Planctomycetaceae bacterium]|nr:hypothetical protein [Planctomycetaceae bacterium]
AVKRSLLAHLQPLRDEISLLQSDLLGNKEREILEAAHALQPVYRSQGAVIVVLPEIRIEDRRQSHWAALRQWLKKHPAKAAVVEDKGDRMTLRVVSGDGRDAIDLANQLTSELDVEVAQPRFLRIVGRPNLS